MQAAETVRLGADRSFVTEVVTRLRSAYGRHSPRLDLHPTDELIATILSQNTSDINSGRAFEALNARFSSWQEVATVDPATLADTIRMSGLGNIKARRIQAALHEIDRRFGTLDLGFLRNLDREGGRAALQGIPGVGPKTAACVLMFACDLPALPVDTHVHRVTLRLGLIAPGTSADSAHQKLEAIVCTEDVYDFHVNLVAHGRQVCHARRPRCDTCVLNDLCRFFAEHIAPEEVSGRCD